MPEEREHQAGNQPHRPRSGGQRPRPEEDRAGAGQHFADAEAPAAEPAGAEQLPEAPDDRQEVVVPGRASKRRAFFERHTGKGAQILGFIVLVVAVAALIFRQCDGRTTQKEADVPPGQAAVQLPEGWATGAGDDSAPEAPEPDQPAGPALQLTEAQVQALDAFLDAWAGESTWVKVLDEDGNEVLDSDGKAMLEAKGGHEVAVWFYDIGSGAGYSYNAGRKFTYASLMKAPYAHYLYEQADAGLLDLEALLTVGAGMLEHYSENSGILKDMALPQTLSTETLIGLMLEYSDTIALKVLTQHHSIEGFKAWAGERGLENPEELSTLLSGRISAEDLSILWRAVYEYVVGGPSGGLLRQHMLDTNYNIITSQYAVVHKYGWDEYAYHDMAIVEAPSPYLLIILTDKWGGSWTERQVFGEIAGMLEGFMEEIRQS